MTEEEKTTRTRKKKFECKVANMWTSIGKMWMGDVITSGDVPPEEIDALNKAQDARMAILRDRAGANRASAINRAIK